MLLLDAALLVVDLLCLLLKLNLAALVNLSVSGLVLVDLIFELGHLLDVGHYLAAVVGSLVVVLSHQRLAISRNGLGDLPELRLEFAGVHADVDEYLRHVSEVDVYLLDGSGGDVRQGTDGLAKRNGANLTILAGFADVLVLTVRFSSCRRWLTWERRNVAYFNAILGRALRQGLDGGDDAILSGGLGLAHGVVRRRARRHGLLSRVHDDEGVSV